MDVKNNLVRSISNTNGYAGENGNSLKYETQTAADIEIKKFEMTFKETKADLSSNNFNQSEQDGYSKKELDDAVKKVNDFFKSEKTHAEYSTHEDFGTLMIKIVSDETKEVILEVPPKKILDMVASMCRQVGLFDKKA